MCINNESKITWENEGIIISKVKRKKKKLIKKEGGEPFLLFLKEIFDHHYVLFIFEQTYHILPITVSIQIYYGSLFVANISNLPSPHDQLYSTYIDIMLQQERVRERLDITDIKKC